MATLNGTEHYVSRADGRIYYYKVGTGDPLIFLHASGGTGETWNKVIGNIAQHFTCHNIDMPGFGHSDVPPTQYSADDTMAAIVSVMDHAGIEQTNIIADHTGSLVSMNLAGTHPQRIKKMVLDGLPYWNAEVGQLIWEKFFLPSFTDTTSFDIPVVPLPLWEDAEKRGVSREEFDKTISQQKKSRRWARLMEESNTKFDCQAAGPKVKAPTLLIYGEGDNLRRGEKKANDGITGSILKVVMGSKEAAHSGDPEEFSKLALEFLLDR